MNDLAGRLKEYPDAFSVCLCMVKDTSNIFYSHYKLVKVPENVSCFINTTNYCGLLTPAASIEGEKTKETINLFSLWFPDNMLELTFSC